MHIDTSSIADRINQLRPNITARSQSLNQAAINNDQTKSHTDAPEDIAAKRRLQFAPPTKPPITTISNLGKQASKISLTTSDKYSSVGKYESEPGNPINSLLADWGKSDSNYDLNADGTVDTKDLLMLLDKLSNTANPDDRPTMQGITNNTLVDPDISNSPPGKPTNRIDALLADWGKADSNYDFNADGTVNTQDLLILFDKLASSGNSSDPAVVNSNPDITASQPDKPDNRIDALMADWGKTDSNYDLNADGTVNTKDLLMLLAKLAASDNAADPTLVTNNPDTTVSKSDKPDNRIDALFADWGKTDSNYDLNADGTVNTKDLLMLLEKLSASGNAADPTLVTNNPDITVSKSDKPDNRIDALFADWGKTDSNYDLNADGTVNTKDLLMLLEKLAASQSSDSPTLKTNPDTNISEPDKPYTGIEELMADWGKSDSKFDLNSDGTVNTKDLLMLLAGLNQSINKMGTANPILGPSLASLAKLPRLGHSNSHTSVNHAYQKVSTDQAANQLSQRMANNGEAELRRFLTSTDFTNAEKKAILSEYHNLNMGSVGFNTVG